MQLGDMKTAPQNEIFDLIFIMDRSGSIIGSEKDTIGGVNSFIQREMKKDSETTVLFECSISPNTTFTNTTRFLFSFIAGIT